MARLRAAGARLAGLTPRIAPPAKRADPFYLSPPWVAKVREIRALRGAWCERCGGTRGLVLDHKVERRDGGADLDDDNLELLCGRCHGKKTAAARARRARGEV